MANVILDTSGAIVGIFARPQDTSVVIADDDPRIAAYEAATTVPRSVSKAQAAIALFLTPSPSNAGKTLLDDINTAVATAGGVTALWWEHTQVVERSSATVAAVASALELPAAQIDALFVLAAQQEG